MKLGEKGISLSQKFSKVNVKIFDMKYVPDLYLMASSSACVCKNGMMAKACFGRERAAQRDNGSESKLLEVVSNVNTTNG